MSEDILTPSESFSMSYEGADHAFVQDQTRVRAGHPILRGIEHLFKPIRVHYEYEAAVAAPEPKAKPEPKAERPEFETATAAPNEKRK